ncbi:MAG: autotransporter-associated beta strand repeat-containing protein [Thermoguttaceae bacterium]|jgi:hypothetical protein
MFKSIGLVLLICSNLTAAVTIDQVSAWGDPNIDIKGSVTGVDFNNYVVAVSSAPQGVGWWSKPWVSPSTIPIDTNGKWEVSYHTWEDTKLDSIATNFAAALYPKSLLPITGNANTVGIPNYGYEAIAYKERWGQTINLNGYEFGLKTSQAPGYDPVGVGPGNNVFLPTAIYQNTNGTHLTVNNSVCSEMVLVNPLGYGTYTSIFNLNNLFSSGSGVTFGAYLFDVYGKTTVANQNREIDFEAGDVAIKNGGVFQNVVQPYNNPGNLHTINMPTTGRVKSIITWRPGQIDFTVQNLDTSSVQTWTYSGADLPSDPGHNQFRFNAWISDKSIYNPSANIDITVESFAFTSLQPLPTPPTKAWAGGHKDSNCWSLWSEPLNWQSVSETRPDGYGRKVIFGMDIADPVTDAEYHTYGCWSTLTNNETIGELEFQGHFSVTGVQGGGSLVFDNGNDVGEKHDALITLKKGSSVQSNEIGTLKIVLDNDLRIKIEDASDQLKFGSIQSMGLISGPGALILDSENHGKVILSPSINFGANTYTGGTFVEGGTLEIMNGGLPVGSNLTVENGGIVNAISINCNVLTIGSGSTVTIAPIVMTVNQVPEPRSIVLLSFALFSLMIIKTCNGRSRA